MLLDLGLRFVINPSEYVGTLTIRLETDDRPGCGVRSGRHHGFTQEEGDQPMPRFRIPPEPGEEDYGDFGMYDFLIDRPEGRAGTDKSLRYHYVATGWSNAVYSGYHDVWLLTLCELPTGWHVAVGRPGTNGFDLILPDYEPGWLDRSGVLPIADFTSRLDRSRRQRPGHLTWAVV
jgi:hypothetical protein